MNLLLLVTGLAQTTVVLLATGLIARRLRPLAPASAANVGAMGLLLSLALILFAVMDVPRPLVSSVTSQSGVTVATGEDLAGDDPTSRHRIEHTSRPSWSLSAQEVARWLGSHQISSSPEHPISARWLSGVIAVSLFIAVLPIMVGLAGTIQLHHNSEPVRDEEDGMRLVLVRSADGMTRFDLRTSEIAHAPCVTLYGGQTIYLPTDWLQWSDAELSAAIAHEAAHLRHGDPWKRVVVQFVTALQFFHPLAHWLRRGVMLSQEMAADREAASAGADRYASSLSRMALRLDAAADAASQACSLKQWFLRPGIVSVSSSHLIRRIEMLTKHPNGCASRKFRIGSSAALVGLFAICASWAVRADQPTLAPQEDGSPSARIASLTKPADSSSRLFAQPRLAPQDKLGPNHQGFFAVRVENLLRHPIFGALVPSFVEPHLDTGWRMIATEAASDQRAELGLGIENVEYLFGSLTVDIAKKEAEEEGGDAVSSITVGSEGGMIRFKQPVAHDPINRSIDWKRVAQGLEAGGLKPGDLGDTTTAQFVETFRSNAFTDGAENRELLLMPAEKEFDKAQLARLQRGWNAVDGGMVAACGTLPETIGFIEDSYDQQADKIHANAACMAIGLDFENGMQPAHVRLVFVPRENVSPSELEQMIREFARLAREKADSVIAEGADNIEDIEQLKQVLSTHQIQLVGSTDEAEIDCVRITFRLPIELLHILVAF